MYLPICEACVDDWADLADKKRRKEEQAQRGKVKYEKEER